MRAPNQTKPGRSIRQWLTALLFCLVPLTATAETPLAFIDGQIAAHPGKSGTYMLETGAEALLARAWLADHAEESIEVQYFIWSTDNIGILAAESLLRAAERGVKVRVIVDDLLIDAPDKTLLALALHPNIEIKIYNPLHSVGTPLHTRLLNVAVQFRNANQRMHDKTFIVDGKIAITGGRNMADEYFDYDHEYNFRDRDVLLLGPVAKSMRENFDQFWGSKLSQTVESLFDGLGLLQKRVNVRQKEIGKIYGELHAYAQSPENFTGDVHAAIDATPDAFPRLAKETIWSEARFVSDNPGKNDTHYSFGGGLTTAALAGMFEAAQQRITIQTPYLVLSKPALALFKKALKRGVRVRINTNSLASTDNLQAFSGYRNQRKALLRMGVEIFEYRPDPESQKETLARIAEMGGKAPVFALHAKSMVVDGETVFIGTYNLDPRSENLNTEVGVIVRNEKLAHAVEAAIEADMQPGNSWNAATDKPDRHVSLTKQLKVLFWQIMPIKPLL